MDRSDDELLRATPTEPEAFGLLYRRHEAAIGAYFMRRTGDPELAADLTAETFAAALISTPRYRSTGPVVAWLFGIAQNLLRRSLERRRAWRTAPAAGPASGSRSPTTSSSTSSGSSASSGPS